ncbi:MAG TPA: hypothetical protein VGO62_08915, partial [Myxococcota bacterium]|jgi:hypothetical protein
VVPGGICLGCLTPLAAGYAVTWIGDRYGPSRAAALWPIIAAYVATTLAAIGAGALVITLISGGAASLGLSASDRNSVAIAGYIGIGSSAVAAGAVPLAYALSAEPKAPGDDGSGQPGWLSAARPMAPATPDAAPPTHPAAPRASMRY